MQRSRRWVGFGSSRSVRLADVADIVVRISLPEGKFSFGETTERTHSHADKHWAVLFRAATSSAKPGGLRVSQQRSQEVEAHERLINRFQTPPHPSVFSSRPTASGSNSKLTHNILISIQRNVERLRTRVLLACRLKGPNGVVTECRTASRRSQSGKRAWSNRGVPVRTSYQRIIGWKRCPLDT